MLNYTKLRNIEHKEKASAFLTTVGSDFYKEAARHIKQMEERLEEEKRKNPASKKVSLIADEIRNTKRIWESIFERREKKIVLAALATVRGGKSMPENLTREEKVFYDSLVHLMEEYRKKIFEQDEKDFVIVKILENLPSFVGSDMKKYFLKKEDVISLPPEIADVLIKRKAAVEIKANF
ncbi:MAG TPA: hypothetical protein ENJ70_03015 [Thermoplasmatales archaeon]|nr:hypothetical protein [Thermoplasmatales archaeon]